MTDALFVVKLSEHATVPARATPGSAGYDLAAAQDCTVPAHGKALVRTDIAIKLPRGTYGRVAPRSGLALKHHIDVGAGVIDEDYRGNVGVVLFNHSDANFDVKRGDRVAQLVLEKIATPAVLVVGSLDDTARGDGGFGSTELHIDDLLLPEDLEFDASPALFHKTASGCVHGTGPIQGGAAGPSEDHVLTIQFPAGWKL